MFEKASWETILHLLKLTRYFQISVRNSDNVGTLYLQFTTNVHICYCTANTSYCIYTLFLIEASFDFLHANNETIRCSCATDIRILLFYESFLALMILMRPIVCVRATVEVNYCGQMLQLWRSGPLPTGMQQSWRLANASRAIPRNMWEDSRGHAGILA